MSTRYSWLKKSSKSKPSPEQSHESNVIHELREVRRQLSGIASYFAMESDEDLIDAAIYLNESLEARHRYLLKQAREQNAVALTLPIESENQERWIN